MYRLIEGEWTDEEIVDPLSQMIALLTEKRDRTLTQQWGIWLVKRDADRALKVVCHFMVRHWEFTVIKPRCSY